MERHGRILRLPSITDQIFIKAQRIRSIQDKGVQKVNDPIKDEFIGIINYCLIALIQMQLESSQKMEMAFEELEQSYDKAVEKRSSFCRIKITTTVRPGGK